MENETYINEENIGRKDKIVDIEFTIQTEKNDVVEYVSDKINGYLEGIYINCNQNTSIKIYTQKTKRILFNESNIAGENFYLIRCLPKFNNKDADTFPTLIGEKFPLNEESVFEIQGRIGLKVDILIRYEK
jgi:hypothetical protein